MTGFDAPFQISVLKKTLEMTDRCRANEDDDLICIEFKQPYQSQITFEERIEHCAAIPRRQYTYYMKKKPHLGYEHKRFMETLQFK